MPQLPTRFAVTAILCLTALPALATDNSKELNTAATHAGMAAAAEAPQMVRTHLQHVLNCLEGPKGANFNAALGNPCASQGDGAIPDAASDQRKKLESAAGSAKQALAEQNIDKAKQMAAEIQSELGK